MLKLIDDKPREENETYRAAEKAIAEADRFILIYEKDNKLYHLKFNLSSYDLVYFLEDTKHKIFISN